jgi:hypothetical protein
MLFPRDFSCVFDDYVIYHWKNKIKRFNEEYDFLVPKLLKSSLYMANDDTYYLPSSNVED